MTPAEAPAAPVRLRLSRAPGFDLQALSRATNGLPVTAVGRPSRWRNQFRIEAAEDGTFRIGVGHYLDDPPSEAMICLTLEEARTVAVEAYKQWTEGEFGTHLRLRARAELHGHNLACWCSLDAPCHADVLLRLANTTPTGGHHG